MKIDRIEYNAESWVKVTISKVMRKHQIAKCFNCGIIGDLRRDCKQEIPRNTISFGKGKNKKTQLSGICRRCGKCQHWINECRSTKDRSVSVTVPGLDLLLWRPLALSWSCKGLWLWSTPLEVFSSALPRPAEDLAQAYSLRGLRLTPGPAEFSGSYLLTQRSQTHT